MLQSSYINVLEFTLAFLITHLSSISSDPQIQLQTMVHDYYLHSTNYQNITGLLNGLMDSQNIELYSHILEKFIDDCVNQTAVLST